MLAYEQIGTEEGHLLPTGLRVGDALLGGLSSALPETAIDI
jgi:hypothetical protein